MHARKDRNLALQVVVYDFMFRPDPNLGERPEQMLPFLESFDALSFWVWQSKDMHRLPEALAEARRLAKGKKIYLGLYMWDFGEKHEMKPEIMKYQLDLALEKWKAHEIDGVKFFVTSICNRDFEAVKITREWAWKHMNETR